MKRIITIVLGDRRRAGRGHDDRAHHGPRTLEVAVIGTLDAKTNTIQVDSITAVE